MAWNGSNAAAETSAHATSTGADVRAGSAGRGNRPRIGRGLAAGLIVALGAGLAAWLIFGRSAKTPPPAAPKSERKTQIAEAKPSSAPTNAAPRTVVKEKPLKEKSAPKGRLIAARTNDTGVIIEDYIMPNGEKHRSVRHPPPIWDNAADQVIAMALSITAGSEAAPFPAGISDEEFRKALKKPIVIKDTDSDKIKGLKERVREARQTILEMMEKSGQSFEEIVQNHREEMNNGTKMYQDALKGLAEVRRTGTPEDVHKYTTVMNAALQQVGAKQLPYDESAPAAESAQEANAEPSQQTKKEKRK